MDFNDTSRFPTLTDEEMYHDTQRLLHIYGDPVGGFTVAPTIPTATVEGSFFFDAYVNQLTDDLLAFGGSIENTDVDDSSSPNVNTGYLTAGDDNAGNHPGIIPYNNYPATVESPSFIDVCFNHFTDESFENTNADNFSNPYLNTGDLAAGDENSDNNFSIIPYTSYPADVESSSLIDMYVDQFTDDLDFDGFFESTNVDDDLLAFDEFIENTNVDESSDTTVDAGDLATGDNNAGSHFGIIPYTNHPATGSFAAYTPSAVDVSNEPNPRLYYLPPSVYVGELYTYLTATGEYAPLDLMTGRPPGTTDKRGSGPQRPGPLPAAPVRSLNGRYPCPHGECRPEGSKDLRTWADHQRRIHGLRKHKIVVLKIDPKILAGFSEKGVDKHSVNDNGEGSSKGPAYKHFVG